LEARDTLRAVLAPALRLPTLLRRGPQIAQALRVSRVDRPMQMTTAAKFM